MLLMLEGDRGAAALLIKLGHLAEGTFEVAAVEEEEVYHVSRGLDGEGKGLDTVKVGEADEGARLLEDSKA